MTQEQQPRINPDNEVLIGTVSGRVQEAELHEGQAGREYSLLRVVVQAGKEKVPALVSATESKPQAAKQARDVLRPGQEVLLRGALRQDDYRGRPTFDLHVFQHELAGAQEDRAVFYGVGKLLDVQQVEGGAYKSIFEYCRQGQSKQYRNHALMWFRSERDPAVHVGKVVLVRGHIINRMVEDQFGVPIDRKQGLFVEYLEVLRAEGAAAAEAAAEAEPEDDVPF